MAEVTHLRIIFPLGFNYRHMLKTYWDKDEDCLVGSVLHKNDYWRDNPLEPNFAFGMDVHVGVERPIDEDLFGNPMPVPAQGILRGEYLRWEHFHMEPMRGAGGFGWLTFRLRYDMQEGPETWAGDWAKVYSTDQASPFYYAWERRDG